MTRLYFHHKLSMIKEAICFQRVNFFIVSSVMKSEAVGADMQPHYCSDTVLLFH